MNLFDDLFIFEMANNHQGDVAHGIKIVRSMGDIARRFNVSAAVKLQYRDLKTFIHPNSKGRQDIPHVNRFETTELSPQAYRELVAAIQDEGLLAVVTPFDEVSVERCVDHEVDVIKVASCSAADWPLLENIAITDHPVIASTGGAGLAEIDALVSFLTHKDKQFALMHCVSLYPMPGERAYMNFLEKMCRRYPGVQIGWSGHEAPDNLDIVKIAVAKGARLFERHVGIPTDSNALNAYSMNPEQVEIWLQAVKEARAICGENDEKAVSEEEAEALFSLQRGVYAKGTISKGETIAPERVYFAMPVQLGQTTSGEFSRYRATYVASRDYASNEPIVEVASQPDRISLVRGVIHDVKGMLCEAQIAFGSDFSIELSHHHGIEQIRETGAAIISVINRDYCKKLIVVLPGQQHPAHGHKIKEETFQLLWGDLEAAVNGETMRMKPGDKLLVEPGSVHSFRSDGGAIFEEISTTHFRDDSYYEDREIQSLDPMERKTIVTDW